MPGTGVFICHCGANIADVIDVDGAAEAARGIAGVAFATGYKYLCSQPGQQMMKEAIAGHGLDRVVIAACSPRMHEGTFQKMLKDAGLNPYMLEIANIREQCAWVHADGEKATIKAIDLIRMAAAKAGKNAPLHASRISIVKKALVIGGGIAGIQAALDIADAGWGVDIVEKEPSIGGHMVMLDKTFPTLDCAACIGTPKMAEAGAHGNIALKVFSEVESVSGHIGNFEARIRRKARYVNHDVCTGCGLCGIKCPRRVPSEFNLGMGERAAIYNPFAQAVPGKPVIDAASCRKLGVDGKCGVCEKICPAGAIDFDDKDEIETAAYGAIIVATGFEPINWRELYPEYGAGRFPDVITGLQLERLMSASGPTEGRILRPSDGKEPKTVAIVKCVGSRDRNKGKSYCSRACCMYAAKHAHQILEKIPGSRVHVFYMDVRAPGKGYEEFYERAREDGADYIRGRVSKIHRDGEALICRSEDTLLGRPVEIAADLVVLETAMVPATSIKKLAAALSIATDSDGWVQEAHPKLRPAETHTAGVFLAGTCQGPKDIPDSVAQGSAAAAKVCALFGKTELEASPVVCSVDVEKCSGCEACVRCCPYNAISAVMIDSRDGAKRIKRGVAEVNPGLCRGCGACAAACRTGAMDLKGFTDAQILMEVDALCL